MSSRRSDALDRRIVGERVWLDLTTMRLLTHPELSRVFVEYLLALYHSMHTAGALMVAARQRSIALAGECPVAAALVTYWSRHILEEAGHDRWLLEDMQGSFGVDPERDLRTPPLPEVAELMGTLHFWVLHTHPIAALAYFYVVERNPPSSQLIDWLAQAIGVPRQALRTFSRHATIDVAHGRELEDLVNALPLTEGHQELLIVSASTVLRQLARLLNALIVRADVLRQGSHAR